MLQTLRIPGCKCIRLQLLSKNSFEDDDLPVQVKEKHMCSHGFRQELRTFQPNTFQDMFLDTWKLVWENVLLNCPTMAFCDNKLFRWKKSLNCSSCFQCSTIPVVLEMYLFKLLFSVSYEAYPYL